MSNTSTIHIKTDFDCKVYDYGQELGTTQADTYFNIELRKGEHELTFAYTEDESISKTIYYTVVDADCDYRLIVEIIELLYNRAKSLYDSEEYLAAFNLFETAATKGYAFAQYELGECFYYGEGVKKDFTKAVAWYTKAGEQGNIDAQYSLGYCYYCGLGVEKDFTKAVEWYTKAGEQGNIDAQYNLGYCYYYGAGVEKDFTKAVGWYTKAGEQGNIDAQYSLGHCYNCGLGVEKDFTKAVEWFTKAGEQGNTDAQSCLAEFYYYGVGVEKDFTKAVEWYAKAAEQGNPDAQNSLGSCYYYGEGVEKDFTKAVEWYTKAAEQGNPDAQNSLGSCYYYGEGVEKDFTKAVEWYTKAAEQGNTYAQYSLGECFYYGEGVEKDLKKATEWISKAAEHEQEDESALSALLLDAIRGDADAQYGFGTIIYQSDLTKAAEWFAKAAKQGNPKAQDRLGSCYAEGLGVEKNPKKAFEWFSKAAKQNDAWAKYHLCLFYSDGECVKQNPEKAIKWFKEFNKQRDEDGIFEASILMSDWVQKEKKNHDSLAQYNIGYWLEHFYGTEKDIQKAIEWYTKAAKQGNEDAQKALDRLKPNRTNCIEYLFFDTETTGVPRDYNAPTSNSRNWPRLVQLSWITTDKDCNSLSQNNFIIYPDGFTIPKDAAQLHGITTSIAKKEGNPLKEVMEKFMVDFNAAKAIVGHNIAFDKKIIGAELIRLGQKDIMDSKESICTMEASTDYCKIPGSYGYKWPKLQELHKKLFGYEFEDAHNSMSDVKATLKCFKEMRRIGLINNKP